ncbi:hypothetical protein RHOSPDRAFT_35626 [Rhodotorula sp. JG-1b]|nr:hypothetical protein RHOSPDRAFT_35626 [Rhodotorula sp. JG-1b]
MSRNYVLSVNVPSYGGCRYVVTFANDHSRMLWRFKAAAENKSGKHIQRLRSDNGGFETSGNIYRLLRQLICPLVSLDSEMAWDPMDDHTNI